MATTFETGHAKNVANFEALMTFCASYGTAYNPSNTAISLANLSTMLTNANSNLAAVISFKNVFITETNNRQNAFAPLRKLCTRIINALDATNAPANLVKDAKSINNKIQGRRSRQVVQNPATGTGNPPLPPNTTISASQQSFDNLIQNFASLIQLVTNAPEYNPNETELQPATLATLLNNLRNVNTAVMSAYTNYSNSLITRNTLFYATQTGLYDTAQEVKKYVKSLFGAASPQYRQVSNIKFTKPRIR
jgi:hypothetical protein